MKKKGNPVPSLENLSLQKYPELTDCWGNDCNKLNRKIFIENINFYLQNGVETNKEQPIKSGHMTTISWGSKIHPDEKKIG